VTFDWLCNTPKSAADYMAVSQDFDTIIVREIPQLTIKSRDVMKRFIIFIDEAYYKKKAVVL
jgi:protein AFG1